MTVEEVFSQVGQHMIEGLMVHSQMADYYAFLGFQGFQKKHEYHYFEESWNYKKLSDYYMTHYHKILLDRPFQNPNIIPDGWVNHTQMDVSLETKKASVQSGFEKWIDWEKQTKILYQQMYRELISLGEVAGAIELSVYIEDVSKELAAAEQEHLNYLAMEYSMTDITLEQQSMAKKYCKKIREVLQDA